MSAQADDALPPDLVSAMELIDRLKAAGFRFDRIAPGEYAPLVGKREGISYVDEVYLAGFGGLCSGRRRKRYSLIVPGGLPVTETVSGSALTVLWRAVGWHDDAL